jgi:hypothetical protein
VAERTNSEVKDILQTDWFSLWLPGLGPCAPDPSGLVSRETEIRRHPLASGEAMSSPGFLSVANETSAAPSG